MNINMESFSQVFVGSNLIFYIVFAICNGVFLYCASLKFLLSMQQSGYRQKRYLKWLANPETPYLSRLMLLCLLGFLFFCVLNTCFSPLAGDYAAYIGFISYALFTALYINSESSINVKVPLNKTKRLVRLCITFVALLTLSTFGFILLLDYVAYIIGDRVVWLLRYALVCGLPILTPYILIIASSLNYPFERAVNKKYILRAKDKLSKSKVIKIGITGSYGKTSVKEILNTLLSQKYRVLSTPKSYNTPLGIALAVKHLDSTHDIFIAEMGARNIGDIKEVAEIVKPTIGVLTGINSQHLETFQTIENTKKTKYELFECLGKKGVGFFNSDNGDVVELYEKFGGEKYLAGMGNSDGTVFATDIKTGTLGTEFILNVKGEKPVKCNTVLLGEHSVSNICLAVAVAYKIGLNLDAIVDGIARLTSVGHRLELVPNNKGIVIIDDSYNSNENGVKAAMDVLDTFKGRKIVLTPGLIELGKEENVKNYEFGKTLSRHADLVYIIGKHNAEMLIKGLLDGGMDKNKITFAKTLNKGNAKLNTILKKGDVVLFENDLPDNYT